jgi:hypothetical protein
VTARQHLTSSTAQTIRAFLASHDAIDPADRQAVFRIRARIHGEQYRREREHYAEWVDFGGEG